MSALCIAFCTGLSMHMSRWRWQPAHRKVHTSVVPATCRTWFGLSVLGGAPRKMIVYQIRMRRGTVDLLQARGQRKKRL